METVSKKVKHRQEAMFACAVALNKSKRYKDNKFLNEFKDKMLDIVSNLENPYK